jgi:hypothetical protein
MQADQDTTRRVLGILSSRYGIKPGGAVAKTVGRVVAGLRSDLDRAAADPTAPVAAHDPLPGTSTEELLAEVAAMVAALPAAARGQALPGRRGGKKRKNKKRARRR